MKVDTFFQNFELLTDAPNASVKLREIILQLAVMGKLISQDANDGAVSILLEKIQFQKEQLVKDKKNKKSKSVLPLEQDEIPFQIPSTWMWSKLDNICINITDGFHNTPKPTDSGIPYLTAQHIKPNFLDFKNCLYVSEKDHNELVNKTRPSKGDILVVNIGAGCGIPAIIDVDFEFSFKNVAIFNKSIGINSEFLYYFLLRQREAIFNELTKGGAQPFLSLNKLRNIPVPLPPLAEQKRIVEKCDRLLSTCDEIEKRQQQRQESILRMNESAIAQLLSSQNPDDFRQHWQRICNNFDLLYSIPETIPKLRQAILQLAILGKLSVQQDNDEPALLLLQKIKVEKEQLAKDRNIDKSEYLPPINAKDVPCELPNGWQWCRLGDFTTIKGGKRLPPGAVLTRNPTPYIYIRVSDMKNGTIDDSDLHYIDEDTYEKIKRYIIEREDLYLTIVGSTIGKLGTVPDKFHKMNLTENAARIILYMVDKLWLKYCLDSQVVQNQFFDKTNQLGQPKLALKRVASVLIPLPPLAEQKRIVEKCDRLMSLCDTLEAKLKQGRDSSEKLMEVAAKQVLTA